MVDLHVAFIRGAPVDRHDALRIVHERAKFLSTETSSAGIGLLVAPEYFFRRKGMTSPDKYHLRREEKEEICKRLKEISAQNPNVIIIPGTVAWWDLTEEYEERVQLLPAEDFSDSDSESESESESDSDSESESGERVEVGERIAFNTGLICHDGKVTEIDKREMHGELPLGYVWGNRFGVGFLDLKVREHPVRLGVEICADHGEGVLVKWYEEKRLTSALKEVQRKPDVHVIVSDFVFSNRPNFVVREGGFVIHASTKVREEKVGGPDFVYEKRGDAWSLMEMEGRKGRVGRDVSNKKKLVVSGGRNLETIAPKGERWRESDFPQVVLRPDFPGSTVGPENVKVYGWHNKRVTNAYQMGADGGAENLRMTSREDYFIVSL